MAITSNLSAIKQYDPAAAASKAVQDVTSTKDLTQNFLKMLTVQLKNQDPMNPTDTASMTTQLAQLNMVDGINKMNTSMGSLLSQIQSSDFINMSTTVGKYAMAPGSNINFDGSTPVNLAANLANDASSVIATITNELGQKVLEVDLGAANAGIVNFSWDGFDTAGNPLAAGAYKLSIASTATDGKDQKASSYVSSRVATIGKNGSDIEVNLADGRTLTPSEIVQWVA